MENDPYLNLQGVIEDIRNNDVSDADVNTLERVSEQITELQRNYKQLAIAMGADIDQVSHRECIDAALLLNKVKTAILHERAEETGTYYITGETGDKDEQGLPEFILVSSQYGLDGFTMYKRGRSSFDEIE